MTPIDPPLWDRAARLYDRQRFLERRALRSLAEMLKNAGAGGGALLDVGTGTGAMLAAVAVSSGPPLLAVGVDPSPAMLARCRSKPASSLRSRPLISCTSSSRMIGEPSWRRFVACSAQAGCSARSRSPLGADSPR